MGPGADMAHLNAQRDNKSDPTSERRFSLRKRIVEAGDERPSMLEDGILALADDLVHSVCDQGCNTCTTHYPRPNSGLRAMSVF
jgi:hypothetical protein